MAIVAAAGGKGRNHGMAQPREKAFALTRVIQRIFLEGFRERVACRGADRCNPEVGAESLGVTLRPLLPFRRGVVRLVNASHERRTDNWIGTECVEEVVTELHFLGR